MTLNIPDAVLSALLTRWDDDEHLYFVTITHPNLETIRLVRNSVNVTSRGDIYTAAPLVLKPATDDEELPGAEITIPNVDRAIGRALMEVRPPMRVTIEAAMHSDPDNPFRSWRLLDLTQVNWNAVAVTGRLSYDRLNTEPHPNIRVTPGKFPAFWR